MTKCKLSPMALGLAMGVLWALSLLILGLLGHFGYDVSLIVSTSSTNAFEFSFAGGFVALLLAFLDGFFRGAIFAFLYNLFLCCCCKKEGKCG